MKISIIVPVYNVEAYIRDCLESLIYQTIDDFEIIIVNDGSTDGSIDIAKEYISDKVKIISQENQGLSVARNTGLKIAKGEYVFFIDSDDYIAFNKCLEDMYNIAKKDDSDIVAGNALWYYSENNNYPLDRDMKVFNKSPMKSDEFLISCIKSHRLYAPVCFNIYKRSLLIDNNLYFKEGIYHEDEEFTPRVLLKAKCISIYDKDFYIYRQREGSITNNKINYKRGEDLLETYLELQNVFKNIKNEELSILIRGYWARIVLDQIYKYKFKNISKLLKKTIYNDCNSKELKIRSLLLNINTSLFIWSENLYRMLRKEK